MRIKKSKKNIPEEEQHFKVEVHIKLWIPVSI